MGLVDGLIGQVGNGFTVDPCLDAGALGNNAVFVPLAILEMLVRLELSLWSEPAATCCLPVHISCLGALCSTGLNLDLWAVDPSAILVLRVAQL